MVRVVREIKVTIYIDSNKDTVEETYEPEEDESLGELLLRLARQYGADI